MVQDGMIRRKIWALFFPTSEALNGFDVLHSWPWLFLWHRNSLDGALFEHVGLLADMLKLATIMNT